MCPIARHFRFNRGSLYGIKANSADTDQTGLRFLLTLNSLFQKITTNDTRILNGLFLLTRIGKTIRLKHVKYLLFSEKEYNHSLHNFQVTALTQYPNTGPLLNW